MVKKTKTYNVLEEKDVEQVISKALGRDVKIGEMEISLIDRCPLDDMHDGKIENFYMLCDVFVDGEEVNDEDYDGSLWEFMPKEAYVDVKYIFAFDVKKFKSFERYTDSSD